MPRTPLKPVDREGRFQHTGPNGTTLIGRCDLTGVNRVERPSHISDSQFAQDMGCIIGYWAVNIWEDMTADGEGWPGFDSVRYEVVAKH